MQNELAKQQLAAEPEKQKMQDTMMKLRELGITIREHAAKLEKSVTIPLQFNGEDYELTAPSAVHVGKLGEAIEKDPSILSRKDIMTRLGAEGFSIKKKEAKAPVLGDPAYLKAQEDIEKMKQRYKTDDTDAKQADVTKYELVTWGKLRPDLRGTPEYKKGFLQFSRDIKEQSPYVDALNRQIDVTAKREGSTLRKEFYDSPEVKTYQEVSRQAGVMAEAMEESKKGKNLVAVDQALITIMNKMMDPASVVRESEYARTPGDLPLMNRIKGAYEKIKKGGAGLDQEDREAISKMGKKYLAVSEKKYKSKLHEYKGYLSNYGLDPEKYLNPATIEKQTETDLSAMSDEDVLKALEK